MSRVWKEVELLDTQRLVNRLRLKISWASNLQVLKYVDSGFVLSLVVISPQKGDCNEVFFVENNEQSEYIFLTPHQPRTSAGTNSPSFCFPKH